MDLDLERFLLFDLELRRPLEDLRPLEERFLDLLLLLDSLLNFSRQFLPAHRGSTQDAPLIITSKLINPESVMKG